MKAKRFVARILTVGALCTALLSAGYWATPADAKQRYRGGHKQHRVQRVERVVRHDRPIIVERPRVIYQPRYVYRPRVVEVYRPWYTSARRVYYDDEPFYFNAGLGVFLGGAFLDLRFTNVAPRGYVYYDPYCDMEFVTVDRYRGHLHRHRHNSVLTVVRANVYLD